MTSTKQEMLQAYNALLEELQAREAGELKPGKKVEEKKDREAVQAAESLTAEGVGQKIAALTKQLEAAYQKVQDIAVKTVEGASQSKSLAGLQQFLGEQIRKQAPDK